MIRLLALLSLLTFPGVPAHAQDVDSALHADLRPGWRLANGDHMAALHLTLAPGWKTYWRAPGDAGIPPLFDWQGSDNAQTVAVAWPTPEVFRISGIRSVGYGSQVVFPLRIATADKSADIRLRGTVELGVCKDICVPRTLRIDTVLPAADTRPDPVIAAAIADVPFSAQEAAVRSVRCTISATRDGLALQTVIDMPGASADWETVIETANPQIWVAEPVTTFRQGRILSRTEMMHFDGSAFALDRSAIRITVLGKGHAVDIQGCDG